MKKNEIAVAEFKKGFNCAQAVFSVYADSFGISNEDSKRISAAFGGGIAMQQETCGAVTGAFMLIGCRYFDQSSPMESKALVNEKCKEFIRIFKQKYGSVSCKQLIGFDFKDEQAMKKAKEEGLFHRVCSDYIADACEIVEEII